MSEVSTNSSTGGHSEFSYASPVSTDITRPSLSGCSSLPYRETRTLGSNTQLWDAPGGDFVNEDFRVGGPQLCAVPVWTMRLQPTTPELACLIHQTHSLVRETTNIVNRFGIQNPDIDICTRQSMVFPAPVPLVTILILARRDTVDNRWVCAAREIHALLLWNGYQNVQVEISDERGLQSPTCYPVDEADSIYPVWEDVCQTIIESSNLLHWISLECFRYGREDDPTCNPTSIVLSVLPVMPADWTPTRNLIIAILDSFELWHVAVHIIPDIAFRGVDSVNRIPIPETDSPEKVKAGVSVGLSHPENGSGTLGGFVEIQHPNNETWKGLAITCFHVIYPQVDLGLSEQDKSVIRKWLHDPIAPADPDAARILEVSQPSLTDIAASIEECKREIMSCESPEFKQTKAALAEDGRSVPGPEQRLYIYNLYVGMIENWKAQIQSLQETKHQLGTVFAGSGLLRVMELERGKTMRDWALIEVHLDRATEEKHIAPYGNINNRPFRPSVPIEHFFTANPHTCELLAKAGRTTHYTIGDYSGLKSALIAQAIDDKGQFYPIVTMEHAVTGRGGNFAKRGDSGSLVLNNAGYVVGLLIGGSSAKNVAYFTHSVELIADIKQATGATAVRITGSDVSY